MVTATTTHVPPILTEWWNANSNATALGYADKGSFASESEHSDESPVTARGSSAAACLRDAIAAGSTAFLFRVRKILTR